MSTNGRSGRLDRLESLYRGSVTCPWCRDTPRRYATIDADTGAVLRESMPRDGCPACGRLPLISREYVLEGAPAERKGA